MMELLDGQSDEGTLAALGAEVSELIKLGQYQDLADRFGYAVAFERRKAEAIEEDVKRSLLEAGEMATLSKSAAPGIRVLYYKLNATRLHAAVECTLPLENAAGELLVSLVVFATDRKRIVLEDVVYQGLQARKLGGKPAFPTSFDAGL